MLLFNLTPELTTNDHLGLGVFLGDISGWQWNAEYGVLVKVAILPVI